MFSTDAVFSNIFDLELLLSMDVKEQLNSHRDLQAILEGRIGS
jgi:hypothetical protein